MNVKRLNEIIYHKKREEIISVIEEEAIDFKQCGNFVEMWNQLAYFKEKYHGKDIEVIQMEKLGIFAVAVFEREVNICQWI